MSRSILISGASIAGPTLASWLSRAGWAVTVVERFDHVREQGQNIDVRGVGRQVIRRMGLEDAVRAAHTGETGTDFVDEHGRAIAAFAGGTDDTSGGTAELEILRGQFAKILHAHSKDAEYVFGDQITALHDDGAGVDVEFRQGSPRRFDAVVLAEGLRSRSRALVMPDARIDELGLYNAFLAISRTGDDTDRWRVLPCGRGRLLSLRPDNLGTIQASLSFTSDVRGLDRLGHDDVAAVLRATFADVGWAAPRVLAELDNGSLYFEDIGQAKLAEWSRGRVALLGDAAYCASPVSGMGTTLALAGAYVLAGELAGHDDPRDAFARYEQVLRPLVTKAQQLPPGAPQIAHPRSRLQLAAFRTAVRVGSSPLLGRVSGLAGRFMTPPAEAITLPEYPIPAPA
ncbi:FAD-dependent monooxygenase [Amycolatopsis sp. cmx-8-4]|uniref:FAD-dependent monooxygenase n=1 Tax=Amycolatopsis sp. cmx-8-4 TaxID=2790947 RepID=UPI0039790991